MNDKGGHETLHALHAKAEIREVIHRYFRGADRLDWDLVRTCFHADARDEHGLYVGDIDGLIAFFSRWSSEQYVSAFHQAGQTLVTLNNNEAVAETYVTSCMRMRSDRVERPEFARMVDATQLADLIERATTQLIDLTIGLRIVDRFECRSGDDGWRIAHRFVVHDWNRLDPVAAMLAPEVAGHQGRRNSDDLIYRQIAALAT